MTPHTKGRFAILLSCVFFALTSFTVKKLAGSFDGWFISWFRFLLGGLLTVIVMICTKRSFRIHRFNDWFLRGFFGVIAMVSFYIGISMTSSGRATLLSTTYPAFVALFGVLFYQSKTTVGNIISIVFCLAGSFVVFYDGSSYSFTGNLLCIGSAVASGFAVIHIKRAREENSSFLVYLSPCIFGILASSWSVAAVSAIPSVKDIILLAFVGCAAFIGQIFMTYGYRFVTATEGSILGMTEILLAIILSRFLLGEAMNFRFFIGTVIIISGIASNNFDVNGYRKRVMNRTK